MQATWDATCYYVMTVWPINISACAIGALLSIFRFSRKLLFVVPAIVGTVWTLDSAAYMIASATQSMALWTDMYVKGGAPMAVRDYTITAIVTATTFAAVYPNTLPRGPLWTRALVVLRLGGNMANYMGAYGIGAATMAIALPCSILGTVASVSLVRPSWGKEAAGAHMCARGARLWPRHGADGVFLW